MKVKIIASIILVLMLVVMIFAYSHIYGWEDTCDQCIKDNYCDKIIKIEASPSEEVYIEASANDVTWSKEGSLWN